MSNRALLQHQRALVVAVDEILAAGKELGLPVAMNGAADVTRRIEHDAHIFMGTVSLEAKRKASVSQVYHIATYNRSCFHRTPVPPIRASRGNPTLHAWRSSNRRTKRA